MIGPKVETWEEWGHIFQKKDAWLPLITNIMEREDIPFEKVRSGYPGTSAVFILDEKYVIKIYPGEFISDHEREWPVLQLLEKHFQASFYTCSGKFSDDTIEWPYLIMPFISGEAIRDMKDQMSTLDWGKFNVDLAIYLNQIHRLPLNDLIDDNVYLWLPKLHLDKQIQMLENLPFFQNSLFRKDLTDFTRTWLPILKDEQVCLVHGDLTEDHLLLRDTEAGWLLHKVIDWGDAHLAPIYFEWAVLWTEIYRKRKKDWKQFIKSYDVNLNTESAPFKNLMALALFLHPFADNLIHYLCQEYSGKKFESVHEFIEAIEL